MMSAPFLSKKEIEVLLELRDSDNPTYYLRSTFENCDTNEKEELRSMISELSNLDCISVMWADNVPWHVTVNKMRIDSIVCEDTDVFSRQVDTIRIGDNNKIVNSVVAASAVQFETTKRRKIHERHPLIITGLISLGTGVLLMFSFWDSIITFVENMLIHLFK